jgi:hypothetical protein
MADNKDLRGGRDRDFVASGQDYEVEHFAQKHGISAEQARELIARHGNDRETLDRAVESLKA